MRVLGGIYLVLNANNFYYEENYEIAKKNLCSYSNYPTTAAMYEAADYLIAILKFSYNKSCLYWRVDHSPFRIDKGLLQNPIWVAEVRSDIDFNLRSTVLLFEQIKKGCFASLLKLSNRCSER